MIGSYKNTNLKSQCAMVVMVIGLASHRALGLNLGSVTYHHLTSLNLRVLMGSMALNNTV